MPTSGPVVAAIVLALAALVGGIFLFMELRHHGARRAREHQRSDPLPLFGTDRLQGAGGAVLPARAPVDARESGDAAALVGDDGAARTRRSFGPPARPSAEAGEGAAGGAGTARANGGGQRPLSPAFAPARPLEARVGRDLPSPFAPAAAHPLAYPVSEPLDGGRRGLDTPAFAAQAVAPPAARPAPWPARPPAFHEGETIRFSIPDEGTLQFLPGRLEVVAGPDAGREVRFVRTPGETRPEITFGRSEGTDYRHVQLVARTVSRRHAMMSLIDGHWELANLSATNPVVLNGRSLADGEVAPLLVEGDRIEMGEVVFVFHER